MTKILRLAFFSCLLAWLLIGAASREAPSALSESIRHFRLDARVLSETLADLGNAVEQIEKGDSNAIVKSKKALADSRLAYKRLEYFLEYFFATSSRIYNRAPRHEVEEPFMEYQAPAGFQYMEKMLFDPTPEAHKSELSDQVRLLQLSSDNLNTLLYKFPGTEADVLESIRLELIRIISLGITGFDAPSLKTGIPEAKVSLEAMRDILAVYSKSEKPIADSVNFHLKTSIEYLTDHSDFDSFDRMQFLTEHALPLQTHLGILIKNLKLQINRPRALNDNAKHIFSANALNASVFTSSKKAASAAEINLGKRLFFDKKLSGNNTRSCASCHNPDLYFSDGLPKSIGFEPGTFVKRNAPSLLYAGLQHNQFWDGRAKSLDMQIETVIKDPLEMHGNITSILRKLNADKTYRNSFQKTFGKKPAYVIREKDIYRSIASYVGSLAPFNSKFDQYVNGNKLAMNENQISGFNLFMGKAQCGTCHFAPLFNGLIPPTFTVTEFEVLGVTGNDNLDKAIKDHDDGRFSVLPISFYKNAFKTPTVRNSAVTAPYMHNGAFSTLETVIDFYDRGGGTGLGLDFPNQTLSSARLNLTEPEKKDIIAFLNALTDEVEKSKK